ncbi:MAG: hypothetical protein H5T63_05370 [Chloroflexi bacterium]|nr:hypothetical protein [Chloroflexota bacterium]
MADWDAIGEGLWKALSGLDAEAAQAEAEKDLHLALIGAAGSGKTTLAAALAGIPAPQSLPPELEAFISEYRLPLSVEDVADLESATLLILLLDATKGDYTQEVAAAEYLSYLGRPMLVCYNKMDQVPVETRTIRGQARWRGVEIMPLTATQPDTVRELLVPAVLEVLPEYALSLARHLPLFRSAVADRLIERTALVNATYAAAAGLAESVPLLRLPLTANDMEMLSANQALLAYRLGLAYGLPLDWHHDVQPLRAAVDVGKLWQQFGRQVVGLVPLWRLESKVRLAYGGTFATGRALQAWYSEGEALSPAASRELCRELARQSRQVSHDLVARAREAMPAPQVKAARPKGKLRLPRLPRRPPKRSCAACGRMNPADAVFCAYCGKELGTEKTPLNDTEERS